jgi:AcrR family transcriptional regulator
MRTKSETRRQAILDAARTIFQEQGFDQATMDAIASRMGCSKATLYNYFDSKETLFMALMQQAAGEQVKSVFPMLHPGFEGDTLPEEVNEVLAVLDPAADLPATLKTFAERALSTFYTPSMLATRRMLIAASNKPEVGRDIYQCGHGRVIPIVQGFFAQAIQAGKLRQADPHIVEAHWRALVNAEVLDPGLHNVCPDLTPAIIEQTAARAVEAFLRIYGTEHSA